MDTRQVTDMSQMFLNCRSLKELDLSSFTTSQVKDMSRMFDGCSDLRTLDISNFNTSQVTNMNGMFAGCETLEKLDLSNFDTTNVKSMDKMFESSDALKSIKLGKKFVVPSEQRKKLKLVDKSWIDIRTGTEDNPKPANKKGINSLELVSMADKGNWIVKPDHEYHGPMTVKINNNLDEDIVVTVPKDIQPEYVGSKFEVAVPTKDNYITDKKTVKVVALEDSLEAEDKVIYSEVKTDTKVEEPAMTVSDEPTPVARPAAAVQEKPLVKGKITDFMNYVTIHPDVTVAKTYSSTGKALVPILQGNHSWYSDKQMMLEGTKYYHVVDDEWVKAEDVYLYKETKSVIQTKDKPITRMIDSHLNLVGNRALVAMQKMESDKIALLNNHKYYQVTTNEFVDSDEVNVVNS